MDELEIRLRILQDVFNRRNNGTAFAEIFTEYNRVRLAIECPDDIKISDKKELHIDGKSI